MSQSMWNEVNETLKAFSKEARRVYGNDSYASGYYEGMLLRILSQTASEIEGVLYMKQLRRVTEDLSKKEPF